MKRAVILSMVVLIIMAGTLAGCGGNEGRDKENGDGAQADYDLGLVEGYSDGYDQGAADAVEGDYDPRPDLEEGWNEDYAAGYEEGFLQGYEDGFEDAADGTEPADEYQEVEEAMLAFVKANSAPGLEFEIVDLAIEGDEAVGRVVCISETLESPLVIMRKGAGGWYGVDFGTGIEPPGWYPY